METCLQYLAMDVMEETMTYWQLIQITMEEQAVSVEILEEDARL